MNAQNITFSANEQVLTKTDDLLDFASNTVSYIEATFTLGTNWTGFDSVRAVWKSDYHTIATVLDANHKCVVPSEILMYRSKVYVNLVGSIAENNVLTDRLTTFPVQALVVTQNAEVGGSETAPITASQFEQFVDSVRDAAESISDYSYDSEAWAVGKRGGVDVPSTDETYHNNSKYWAEQNAGLSDDVADLKSDLTTEENARIALAGRVTTAESGIDTLETHKVAQPLDGNNQPTNGTDGQSLRTKGDGTTEWADVGLPTDAQTAQAVSDWLDEHPEATTTVQDGSLTEAKFSDSLKLKTIKDYVAPEMYGAKGDGVTDDTEAIQDAISSGKKVIFSKTYVCGQVNLISGSKLEGIGGAKIICSELICFDGSGVSDIDIRNIEMCKVDYTPEVESGSIKALIHILNGDNICVENCTIHDCYSGIAIVGCSNAKVLYNHVYNYFIYGVMLSLSYGFICNGNYIHDSTRLAGATYCISATGSDEPQVQKNNIIANNVLMNNESWSAIMSHGLDTIIIQGNQIENVRNGLDLSADVTNKKMVITGNVIKGTDTDTWEGEAAANTGIMLYTTRGETKLIDEVIISSNIVENFGLHNSGSQPRGEIFVSSGCNVIISNNILNHAETTGEHSQPITVNSACEKISICNNIIKSLGVRCVELKDLTCDTVIFTGNTIESNKTTNIVLLQDTAVSKNFVIDNNVSNVEAFLSKLGTNTVNGVDIKHKIKDHYYTLTGSSSVTLQAGASTNVNINNDAISTSDVINVEVLGTAMRSISVVIVAIYTGTISLRITNNYDSAKTITPSFSAHAIRAV